MPIALFQHQPGESILYRATPSRKWYLLVWKIGIGVVGIFLFSSLIFTLLADPTLGAFKSFIPAWAASLLTNFLYLVLVPLLATAWVANEVACMFVSEFILTDQRIWVRGSPYAWSNSTTPLEDISSLTWRRDAVFIRQKSTRKIQVHLFSEGKLFVKAYEQFLEKPGTP